LVYYRKETFEFYTPVDAATLGETSQFASVLTVIDDIYDAYYRLSQPKQVFDIQKEVSRLDKADRKPNQLRGLYKNALNATIDSLLRVLTWREKEIETAAIFSRALGAEHNVLATKHPVSVGARMLLGRSTVSLGLGESYPVYISHPISRPRQENLETGQWPSFVDELDGVVAQLHGSPEKEACHVLPVMPTAIDEFRLLSDGVHLVPRLKPRWPLPEGKLLYSLPLDFISLETFESQRISEIFNPPIDDNGRRVGMPLADDEISGMLRTLEIAVRLHMANRDHLLVRQCPGFFLYRPTYGKHKFSGGVTMEVSNFEEILTHVTRDKRRIAFVHSAADGKLLFDKSQDHVDVAGGDIYKAIDKANRDAGKSVTISHPQPKDVTDILKTFEEPSDQAMGEMLKQMYKNSANGSIGAKTPLDLNDVRGSLCSTVHRQRVAFLTSAMLNDPWRYTYHDSGGVERCQQQSDGEAAPQNIYVDVVESLERNSDRRDAAIDRANAFFSAATQ